MHVIQRKDDMDDIYTKPRLVFFQYKYDDRLPAFLLAHTREHVKCLAEFFEVTVINDDCDYQQICDKYQPDLTLFESGVPFSSCRRPKIINVRACASIPKAGFLNADAFGEGRAGFLSDMDYWGIHTVFAIATTTPDHLPEIVDNLFIWPNFVDAELYRDYGQVKNIPVLCTGNKNALYPWRQKIMRLVSMHYPSLICPHPGYSHQKAVTQFVVGEPYARLLNSSWFVPACGTVAREVVRKHFEIPACKACLITEKSPGLEAAGFVDMVNCVFADEDDVLDKLDYLYRNIDELERITNAGHLLVHSRHTAKQRDQIMQWLTLYKTITPSEKIIQLSPFEPLRIVDRSRGPARPHIIPNGSLLELLRQGDEKLWACKYDAAESLYLKCVNYYCHMPEPQLRLALCSLYKGNAPLALSWITKPIQFTLAEYKALDPDPVEWAYFIIALLCLGRVNDAVKRAGQFPWLRHRELDRARLATNVLKNRRSTESVRWDEGVHTRISIHQLPTRCIKEWIQHLCIMLRQCGQADLADTLMKCVCQEAPSLHEDQGGTGGNGEGHRGEKEAPPRSRVEERHSVCGSKSAASVFRRTLLYSKMRVMFKRPLRVILHHIEAKFGHFLPYRISARRNDELFRAIQDLAREEDIKVVLIIGAALGEGSTEALLAGARENKSKPSVFCISTQQHRFLNRRRPPDVPVVKWYRLSAYCPETLPQELDRIVNKTMAENQISFPDFLLIDGSELIDQLAGTGSLSKELHGARFVVLDDIDRRYNHENYNELLRDSNYVLVEHNPGLRNGYAIFEKRTSVDGMVGSGVEIAPARKIEYAS